MESDKGAMVVCVCNIYVYVCVCACFIMKCPTSVDFQIPIMNSNKILVFTAFHK